MLLFYRYLVNSDGTLMDTDTGRIAYPLTRRKKKDVAPFHLVRDDDGKTHYFSVKYLLEKLGVDFEEVPINESEDYEAITYHDLSDLSRNERIDAILDIIEQQ